MNLEQPCIRISVRNLVEFILRHGDIDNRTGGADKEAMQQGGRIHRKIQRQQGAEYRAEVPLKYQIACDGFILSVEGRADGIIELPKRVVIDEIKGVFKDLKRLKEPQLLHLAQAKCYAYIYAEQKNLEEIGVQMTYCNLDTEEIRRFQEVYTRAELKNILHDEPSRRLDELVDDVDRQNGRQNRRDRGKRGVLPRQHMVRQVADGQRREPAERRRDGQNQQNQKKAFCFRGGRAKMLFQIFGLLHNAHDPFHVAQAMVARIILPHIGDHENGRVRS